MDPRVVVVCGSGAVGGQTPVVRGERPIHWFFGQFQYFLHECGVGGQLWRRWSVDRIWWRVGEGREGEFGSTGNRIGDSSATLSPSVVSLSVSLSLPCC